MPSSTRPALSKLIASIFSPPFCGLPVIVWLYFVASFILYPHSPIWHYNFVDSDDYLYLVQAMDQLKGQGWYDLVQKRINPPEGTYIHFSNLLTGLYALPIFFLKPWLGGLNAATLTAALFPLFFLAAFLKIACWSAEPLVGKDWSRLTSLATLFSLSLLLQFTPGRVDHHGIEAFLALLAFGCVTRMTLRPTAWKMAVTAGFTLAVALDFGLEILPVLLLMTAWIALWAIVKGREAAQTALIFGLTLFLSSAVFLMLTRSPENLSDTSLDAFSLTYVTLAAGGASCFAVIRLAAHLALSISARLLLSGVFAAVIGTAFMMYFPDMIGGPYGGTDPTIAKMILKRSTEAWPLLHDGSPYRRSVVLPVIALLACFDLFRRRDDAKLWSIGLLTLLIATTFTLAIFYQQRLMVYAEAFSVLPLAYAAQRIWLATNASQDRLVARYGKIFALLLIGPLTVVILPLLIGDYLITKNPVFFPVQITQKACDMNGLADVLNTRYGDRPRLIMNAMNTNVEILFRTQHAIIAAPFHKNVRGNLDSYAFFSATDSAVAETIARKRGAELVVLCSSLDAIYKAYDPNNPLGKADPSLFAQQLIDGKIPLWLKPVALPELGNLLLFEIRESGEVGANK